MVTARGDILQFPPLDISIQFAQIGIQQHKPNIEVKQQLADLEIRQSQPEMDIKKSKGKLIIDQSEAFADADLKSPLRRTKEQADKAKQVVLQDIAKEISEGNRLMKIESHDNNTIPKIAKEQSEPPPKYANIKFIPETPEKVKIDYIPSEIDITFRFNKTIVKAQPKSPSITYHPWDINIYLKQKPSIHLTFVGTKIDWNI